MAQDLEGSNTYYNCATVLEQSIKNVMPNANVTILTSNDLPYGDLEPDSDWKLINDWQVYEASPYEYTIKLEADMYIPRNIDHWWDILKDRDLVVSTTIRNFKGDISDKKLYRKFIVDNDLVDCYNAITYFKKSDLAKQFFAIVRNVFEYWSAYKHILKCNPEEKVTSDWAYALACHILGPEKTTLPSFTEMSMVHMKQYVNDILTENWTESLVIESFSDLLRVNTYPQRYPFHYHIKNFSEVLREGFNK